MGHIYNRGLLPQEDKVDVFKFMLESLAVYPSWNKVGLYIKLDSQYESRKQELQEYIISLFPNCDLGWYRNEHQTDWRIALEDFIANGENTFFSCNHDHIFIGRISTLKLIDDELKRVTQDRIRQCYISHWPEMIGLAYHHKHKEYDGLVSFKMGTRDGIQILSSDALRYWFFESDYGDLKFGRTDGVHTQNIPHEEAEILVSFQECVRHFDGYHRPGICQALSLPKSKDVYYGWQTTPVNGVKIHPYSGKRDSDSNGADYTNCFEDLPDLFRFGNYNLNMSDDINHERALQARKEDISQIVLHSMNKINIEYKLNHDIDLGFVKKVSEYGL